LSIGFEEIAQNKIIWTEAPEVPSEPEFDAEAEAMADELAADAVDEASDD
jgi:hypothetical protein